MSTEHVEPLGVGKPKNPAQGDEHLEHHDGQGAQRDEQGNPAYLSEDAQGAQGVHALGTVSEDLEGLQELLANPPEWLWRQAERHLESPT